MVVFGVLLKHDDKMTGDSVQYIYQFLYFHGANFNDIVETMYLSLIVLGVSSLVCCMLGLSDIFKLLRHTAKEKFVSSYDVFSFFERKNDFGASFCDQGFFSICFQNILRSWGDLLSFLLLSVVHA